MKLVSLLSMLMISGLFSNLASANADLSVPGKKINVTVSHQALVQLAQAIFPPGTTVSTFVPPHASAETFEPTPKALLQLSSSQYFLAGGVPFEKTWVPKIAQTHKNTLVVSLFNIPKTENDQEVQNKNEHKQQHGHDHEHDDPHLWLSPNQLILAAKVLAKEVERTLSKDDVKLLQERLQSEISSLEKLQSEIKKTLQPYKGKTFFVFHPSWGEFAKEFELQQEALEKNGHSPTPKYMESFLATMKKEKAKIVYVQPQMSRKEAETVAKQIGAKVTSFDPMALDLKSEILRFSLGLKDDFESRK